MLYIKEIINIKLKINYLLLFLIVLSLCIGYGKEIIIGLISVFIHELSHVILSIKFGIKMDEIELFPFGGIAKSQGFFWLSSIEEILVSAIGPITNIFIALMFLFIYKKGITNHTIEIIIKGNLIIGIFNSLPIFPLDGGKILRGFLCNRMGYKLCTKRLAITTYIIAMFLIVFGIGQIFFYNRGLYIVLIAIFILLAARKEKKMVAFFFINEMLRKRGELVKRRVMGTHLLVGIETVKVKEITEYFLPKRYHIIIVIDNTGKSIGTIHENDLFEGIIEFGIDVTLEKLLINKEK